MDDIEIPKIEEQPQPLQPDLAHALFTLGQNQRGEEETILAIETILAAFQGLARKIDRIEREHNAVKRVTYLLVTDVKDERRQDELHATYTRHASGLAGIEDE